ncbi:hypothetical protein CY34DRAFT_814397 [Suillus luteus UH-Slu-Lm8-n1]|uniref:Uncharacterized protein n=1 Tax=Suillus luteus UH-Slu-Lm8-n1 TaxID=930992 RepID=A0A0C9Z452_9AGAM|nr:hypothetical protein CY34DRAFT_814397 [Suillus luteus UH-Slu-Lm8-n1]
MNGSTSISVCLYKDVGRLEQRSVLLTQVEIALDDMHPECSTSVSAVVKILYLH